MPQLIRKIRSTDDIRSIDDEEAPLPADKLEASLQAEKEAVRIGKYNQLAALQKERDFESFYKPVAEINKLPIPDNPDAPENAYDFRTYFDDVQAGRAPVPQYDGVHKKYRLPPQYTKQGHPDYYQQLDPEVWTIDQAKRYIKDNPAQSPEQEAQYEKFLMDKKSQLEAIQAQMTPYDRYNFNATQKALNKEGVFPHEDLIRDPKKMSAFQAFAVPYTKNAIGFFTRPIGHEPVAGIPKEDIALSEKDHPIASAVGKALGTTTAPMTAMVLAPETLLWQLFAFGGTGAVTQAGKEKMEGSLMDRSGSVKRVAKETVKSAALAPLWYYSKALQVGGPILSATARAGVRGAGTAGIEAAAGATPQEAAMTGLMTAGFSGLLELTPIAVNKINSTIKDKSLDDIANTIIEHDDTFVNNLKTNYATKYGKDPSQEELKDLVRAGLAVETVHRNISTPELAIRAEMLRQKFKPINPEVLSPLSKGMRGESGQAINPFSAIKDGDIVRTADAVGKVAKIVGDNAMVVTALGKELSVPLSQLQKTGLLPQQIPESTLKLQESQLKTLDGILDDYNNYKNGGGGTITSEPDEPGMKTRRFIKTVREAPNTPPEVARMVEGKYMPIGNVKTIEDAKNFIRENPQEAKDIVWQTGPISRMEAGIGSLLVNQLVVEGKFQEAKNLFEHLAKRGTEGGQGIQALYIYERLSPEGILQAAESTINRARKGLKPEVLKNFEKLSKGKTPEEIDALAKKLGVPNLTPETLREIFEMSKKIQAMPDLEPAQLPAPVKNALRKVMDHNADKGSIADWEFPTLPEPDRRALQALLPLQEIGVEGANLSPEERNALQFVFKEASQLGVAGENTAMGAGEQMDLGLKVSRPSREKAIATALMLKKITDQIPRTMGEKISMVQTMAQLLNPKTFVRNLLGNVVFQGTENLADALGTALDVATSLATGKRTVYLPNLKTQAQGLIQGGKEGTQEAILGIDLKEGNTSKFTLPKNGVFDKGVMGALEKTLRISLGATDRAFYQAAFNQSLRQQTQAAGIEEPTEAMIEKAHMIGLYRTFQDDNVLSNQFAKLKKWFNNWTVNIPWLEGKFGVGDLVLKYPKTPANIIARGIEYSPFGFMKTVYKLAQPLAGSEFDQEEFVRSASRAFTGSALLVGAGALLAALGIISGKRTKDKDVAAARENVGIREYQVNISALKRFAMSGMDPDAAKLREGDQLITYDWMQPAAIGIGLGANMMLDPKTNLVDKTLNFGDQMLQASETLQEQPLVRGVKTLTGRGNLSEGLSETFKGIPASFVPTILNQIRQLTDNVSRNTNDPNYFKEAYNKTLLRVPGMSSRLPPNVTPLGKDREVYQGGSNNPFNVFLNPAFVSKYQPDPVSKMVLEIWENSGQTVQFPRVAQVKIKIGKQEGSSAMPEPIELTPAQYVEYQRYIGHKTDVLFTILANRPGFMKMDDEKKAKALQGFLTDINNAAKIEVLGSRPKNVSKDTLTIIKAIVRDKQKIDENMIRTEKEDAPAKIRTRPDAAMIRVQDEAIRSQDDTN